MRAAKVTVKKDGRVYSYNTTFDNKKHFRNWKERVNFNGEVLLVEFDDEEWLENTLA